MQSKMLPYDMGNAGDLIKHGVLAEFTEFCLETNQYRLNDDPYVFYDPFGGRSYQENPHSESVRRIKSLSDCALIRAQTNIPQRYYGSCSIVRQLAELLGNSVKIYVSDRDDYALSDLQVAGFQHIDIPEFSASESFSILNCKLRENCNSLLLLDPFSDFIPDYSETVLPKLNSFSIESSISIILFVLLDNSNEELVLRYRNLKERYIDGAFIQIILSCPNILNSNVRGESRFHVEALLLVSLNNKFEIKTLIDRLDSFASNLKSVLQVPVELNVFD